jgi:TolB-like protein
MSFCFADFELDQERRQLLRSGEPVPLEPKAYELLSPLLERRPRALSRAVSDGVTQEMIAQVGRLHPQSLSVIVRTSVVRYKKTETPVDRIGRELGQCAHRHKPMFLVIWRT